MTRRPWSAVVLAVTGLTASTASFHAQTPVRDTRAAVAPAPAPTGTAIASGVVVTADNPSQPIRSAYVVLIGATTGTLKVTSTDASGKFTFTNLAADRYTIGASKAPYLGAVAGARRPGRPGSPVSLANGERVDNITVRLPMGAAISGMVTNERGQPAPGVLVTLKQWRLENGERTAVNVRSPLSTDDAGRYRFYGLLPGDYSVMVQPNLSVVPRLLTATGVDETLRTGRGAAAPATTTPMRYAPVYFPGTTRAADAGTVSIATGEDRSGIDLKLELMPVASIDGVVTSDGPLPSPTRVTLVSSGGALTLVSNVTAGADGRFHFPSLPPGSYTLTVGATGPLSDQFASAVVDVAGVDQTGLQLALKPALTLHGHLVFDGASPPSVAGRRVAMKPATTGVAVTPQVSPATPAGDFTVTHLAPGRYLLGGPMTFGATSESMTWALASVVVDGQDVTDRPFDITSDAPPKNVVVTYSDRWQELTGRLSVATGASVTDYVVIAFPAERAYWTTGTRRIAVARPGNDGHFQLSGRGPATLPPGDYLIAAASDLSRDEQFDPALLSTLAQHAIKVTLLAGDRKVQDVAIR